MSKSKEQKDSKKGKAPAAVENIIKLEKGKSEQEPKSYPFYEAYHNESYIEFHDNRKNVSLKDKGPATYTLTNDDGKELICYAVDGKLISDMTVDKCDFGLYTEDDLLILIELKGSDYSKAIDQLQSTIDILVKTPHIKVSKICCRVVLNKTKVPDILETKEKKFSHFLKRNYNGALDKRSVKMQENLSAIISAQ